jgi:hypothetical protein
MLRRGRTTGRIDEADVGPLYLDRFEFSPCAAVVILAETPRTFGGNFKGIWIGNDSGYYAGSVGKS